MIPSLRTFNEGLLNSCAELSADESTVLRSAYSLLLEGRPIAPAALATKAGLSLPTLNDLVLRRRGIARLGADGRIQGYLGLSVEPTPHSLDIEGRTLWVWCAWDGLFVPRVLGMTARLTSTCPITGEAVAMTVAPAGVRDVNPQTTVMSFIGSTGPAGNGIGACCPFIHFLVSQQAGARWHSAHPTGCVLGIDEAWNLARTFVDTKLSGSTNATTDPTACSTC